MNPTPTVLGVLRRFLPEFLQGKPTLGPHQRRALWALTHCRTATLGGSVYTCEPCGQTHFAWHSCNHKACPQCGRNTPRQWVQRELNKRIAVPYFLVTFTLPAELRGQFFGPWAKEAFDLFFQAVSGALREKLAADRGLRAQVNGFTAVVHTWNQRLQFHPHIHCLVPGAGLDADGHLTQVSNPEFLVYLPHLQAAFRQQFYQLLQSRQWPVDPKVWSLDWGVHIQPVGSGDAAIKYLGHYVARTAIADSRIVDANAHSVTFRWIDRADNHQTKLLTLPGVEFVERYLRHVLPRGLRSIRYYGYCHPTAKANRLRLQLLTQSKVDFGALPAGTSIPATPCCPDCGRPMKRIGSLRALYPTRGPPRFTGAILSTVAVA